MWTTGPGTGTEADAVVLDADAGWSVSRGQMADAVGQAELLLSGAGVGPGVTVAVALPSRPDLLVAVLAAQRLRALVVLLDVQWWPRELRAAAEVARPALVLAERGTADALGDVAPVLVIAPPTGPATLLHARGTVAAAERAPQEWGTAVACGTTGLWGEPQLLVFTADQMARYWPAPQTGPEDVLLATSLAQAAGLRTALANLVAGGRTSLLERWTARRALEHLARRPVDRLVASGPQLNELAVLLARRGGGEARAAVVDAGSGRLFPRAARQLGRSLGCAIVNRYTLTEAGGWAAVSEARPATEHRPLDVGAAVPGVELLVGAGVVGAGAAGAGAAGAADHGLVSVTGPATAAGKLSPRAAAHAPPWPTGDLGRIGPTGQLELAGRLVERFETARGHVDPAVVELALAEHPGLADVAVTLRPHPREGAVPVAITVPTDVEHPPFLADLDAVLEGVDPHARPRAQAVVERLPLTGGGQVHRRMLAHDEIER